MAGQLLVNTDILRSAGSALATIHSEFANAGAHAKDAAAHLGDTSVATHVATLSTTIRDFADKWDDKRSKLNEGIDALSQVVTQMAQTFDETDHDLAAVLYQASQQSIASPANSTNQSNSPSARNIA